MAGEEAGNFVVKFDVEELLKADGPVRHDRYKPFYTTIANGSQLGEGPHAFNYVEREGIRNYPNNRTWRDGSRPLFFAAWSLQATDNGLTILYNVSFMDGARMHHDICSTFGIAKLVPPSASTVQTELRISYEGVHLKGYQNAHKLEPSFMQEQVVLE